MRSVMVWSLIVLGGALPVTDAAQRDRATRLDVVFVDYCDGLNLRISDRLGVTGTHSGCGAGEFVLGDTLTDSDGSEFIRVSYLDQTVGRPLRIELYLTGFRARKFYVYDIITDDLLRFGDYAQVVR